MLKQAPKVVILFTMVIMTLISSNLRWGKEKWKGVLETDAKGYYAYLPAVFIYHDLNFNFFDKIEKDKYYNEKLFFEYRAHVNGTTIDKFFCGTAIMQMPFFLMAHTWSGIMNYDQDGYSKYYMIAITIAALFYLLIGLIFINKTLLLFNIDATSRAIALIAVVFATNVFYYTVVESGMSHIYSFACVAVFLFCIRKFYLENEIKYLIFASALIGLIILIRPVNGLLILAVPFLAGSLHNLRAQTGLFISNKPALILSVLITMALLFIQPMIYKVAVNSFFVYAYEYEHFNFTDPHFIDILFSYKKGLFLYTPVLLLSLTGFYFLYKKNRFEFYSLAGFLILLNYILSSWWNWWYGGSFSSRVYLEYIPVFAILIGLTLTSLKKRILKSTVITFIFLCILLCQIQTYQYRYYQIHWENMTKEKYWEVFLRLDRLV